MQTRPTIANITCELAPCRPDIPCHIQAAWDRLAMVDAAAPVFNRREWFEQGVASGILRRWHVLLVRDGDQPIALLPLQKVSPWTWQVVSLFGQDDLQVLIDPAREAVAWMGVLDWFRHAPMTAYLRVGGCSSAARVDHFLEACRRAALCGTAKHNLPPVVLCRLPGTWDGLLAEMSASTRKDLRQAERVMQRDYPDMAVEFLTDPADCQRALDVFFQLFHLRWGHASGGTLFDPPGAADCYRRAVDWAVRQGYGTVVTLRAAGEIHVIQTLFHLPGAPLYAQHIVRNTASMPRRYSPGIAVMNATLRWAIEHHFPILNLGYGATAYKLEYHGVAHPRCTLAAAREGFTSSVCPILDFGLRIIRRSPVHLSFHARRLWGRLGARAKPASDA